MEFVRVPAGDFVMGLRAGEVDVRPAPSHPVQLTRPFYLGRFEVTQAEWYRVMGTAPSQLSECGPNCPVESVSWHDVREFLRRLGELNPGERFRLGLLFRDESKPRLEDTRLQHALTAQQKVDRLNAELDRYAV